jgi:hypothetical protein
MGIALAVLVVGGFAWLMVAGLRGTRQLAARRDPTGPHQRGADTTRQWAPQSRQIASAFGIGHWAPIKISWRRARVTLTPLAVVAALAVSLVNDRRTASFASDLAGLRAELAQAEQDAQELQDKLNDVQLRLDASTTHNPLCGPGKRKTSQIPGRPSY